MKTRAIVLASMILAVFLLASSYAQVPQFLDFQGRLTDPATSAALEGSVDLTFRIFNLTGQ